MIPTLYYYRPHFCHWDNFVCKSVWKHTLLSFFNYAMYAKLEFCKAPIGCSTKINGHSTQFIFFITRINGRNTQNLIQHICIFLTDTTSWCLALTAHSHWALTAHSHWTLKLIRYLHSQQRQVSLDVTYPLINYHIDQGTENTCTNKFIQCVEQTNILRIQPLNHSIIAEGTNNCTE